MTDTERQARACVICTSPRSGSTLMGAALGGTKRLGKPEEYFRIDPAYRQHYVDVLKIKDDSDYLEKIIGAGSTRNNIFGLKLHWHQVMPLRQSIAAATGVAPEQVDIHRYLAGRFSNIGYVWLRRRNKVAQGISVYRADRSDVWRVRRGADAQAPQILFDFDAIRRRVAQVEQHDRGWGEYFESNRIAPLIVTYEDFVAHYEATVRAIGRLMKIDASGIAISPPAYEKQANQESLSWEQEYRAIIARRRGAVPEAREPADEALGVFAVAREYALVQQWDRAEPMLRRFLLAAGERWSVRRGMAWRWLALHQQSQGNLAAGLACLREALKASPDARGVWHAMAELQARRVDWRGCLDAAQRALGRPAEEGFTDGPLCHLAAQAAAGLGLIDSAREYADRACAAQPDRELFRQHRLDLAMPGGRVGGRDRDV